MHAGDFWMQLNEGLNEEQQQQLAMLLEAKLGRRGALAALCKCGGGSECDGECCGMGGACAVGGQTTRGGHVIPMRGRGALAFRGSCLDRRLLSPCYTDCEDVDDCLLGFFAAARTRMTDWEWTNAQQNDIPIVHFDTSVGIPPNYNLAPPLVAGDNLLLRQEAAQRLPWQPGVIKMAVAWTGNPASAGVTVNFWAGERNLNNITDPLAAGLVNVGRSYMLSDFECASDCYLMEFPRIFGCDSTAIPDTRAVYVEIRVGAIGASQITSINPTVIKRHTALCKSTCRKYWG